MCRFQTEGPRACGFQELSAPRGPDGAEPREGRAPPPRTQSPAPPGEPPRQAGAGLGRCLGRRPGQGWAATRTWDRTRVAGGAGRDGRPSPLCCPFLLATGQTPAEQPPAAQALHLQPPRVPLSPPPVPPSPPQSPAGPPSPSQAPPAPPPVPNLALPGLPSGPSLVPSPGPHPGPVTTAARQGLPTCCTHRGSLAPSSRIYSHPGYDPTVPTAAPGSSSVSPPGSERQEGRFLCSHGP